MDENPNVVLDGLAGLRSQLAAQPFQSGPPPKKDPLTAGPLMRQLDTLTHPCHISLLYETSTDEMGVIVPFFKEGLSRGEACLYVSDDQKEREITGALAAAGIDVIRERERGALSFLDKSRWRNPGAFNPKAMERRVIDIMNQRLAPGFSGLWVAVDMNWAMEPEIESGLLAEWVSRRALLLDNLPVVMLTGYDRIRMSTQILHHELRTQPQVIIGDQVYSNFYFEPPEIFSRKQVHTERVNWMIDQLRHTGQAEQALRDGEERFRLLVERARDYAIFLLDPNGRIISWNEGAQRIKGYTAREIIGSHMSRFYTPGDLKRGLPKQLLELAKEQGSVENEGWRVRKDGTSFWADVVITALRDEHGELRGFGKVTRDLTERKRAEESMRQLSRRLLQLQDEEQHRISRELQANVSPLLDSLASELSTVRDSGIVLDWKTSEALKRSLTIVQDAVKEVKSLSYLLYPRLLDEAGLIEALQWYIGGFTRRAGINVATDMPVQSRFGRFPGETERVLFRVVQESLTNVHRHSGSQSAEVFVKRDDTGIRVEVRDRGKGIAPGILESTSGTIAIPGVGIRGMLERMRQLGGRLEIESTPEGTTVTAILQIPVVPFAGAPPSA